MRSSFLNHFESIDDEPSHLIYVAPTTRGHVDILRILTPPESNTCSPKNFEASSTES